MTGTSMLVRCCNFLGAVSVACVVVLFGAGGVEAACCCEYFADEWWEVAWCGGSEQNAHFWGGIPSDGSFGSCANWVGAGEPGDYTTLTMTAINNLYGFGIQNCSQLFGSNTDCAVADAMMKSHSGNASVQCKTPAEADRANEDNRARTNVAAETFFSHSALALAMGVATAVVIR